MNIAIYILSCMFFCILGLILSSVLTTDRISDMQSILHQKDSLLTMKENTIQEMSAEIERLKKEAEANG